MNLEVIAGMILKATLLLGSRYCRSQNFALEPYDLWLFWIRCCDGHRVWKVVYEALSYIAYRVHCLCMRWFLDVNLMIWRLFIRPWVKFRGAYLF